MRRWHACGALAVTPEGPLHSQSPGGLSCGGSNRGLGLRDVLLCQLVLCIPMTGRYRWWWGCSKAPGAGEPDTAVLDTGCPPLRLSWCWFCKDNEIIPQVSCCCTQTLPEYSPSPTVGVSYILNPALLLRGRLSLDTGFLSWSHDSKVSSGIAVFLRLPSRHPCFLIFQTLNMARPSTKMRVYEIQKSHGILLGKPEFNSGH